MNIKYTLGAIVSIPLLPILYFQAKKLKANFPRLPEAKGTEGTASTSSDKILKMITIGESTIAGVGVKTHQEGFTGTLADELAKELKTDIDWKVYAKSGYTAKKINDRTISKITEESVDLIVIGLGANDAFEMNSPKKWNNDSRELITTIRKKYKNTPIVFMNMPTIKKFPAFTSLMKFTIGNLIDFLGEEVEKVVNDFDNVFYIHKKSNYKELIAKYNLTINTADLFSDGVHPSAITYQIWAKETALFITESKTIKNKLLARAKGK